MSETVKLRQRKRNRPAQDDTSVQYTESSIMIPAAIIQATGWKHGDKIHFEFDSSSHVVTMKIITDPVREC